MVVMCGLPGSGKDTYVRQHFAGWPVVSLDDLREELDVVWTDDQGQVLQAAREEVPALTEAHDVVFAVRG